MADLHTESVLRFAKINAELRARAEAAESALRFAESLLARMQKERDDWKKRAEGAEDRLKPCDTTEDTVAANRRNLAVLVEAAEEANRGVLPWKLEETLKEVP